MKKIAYILGLVVIIFIALLSSVKDIEEPFFKSALVVFGALVLVIALILFCIRLIHSAEQKEKNDYRLLIEGRKSSLLRQCRRIKTLKR